LTLKNWVYKTLPVLCATALALSGCTAVIADPDVINFTQNKVIRLVVISGETDHSTWSPIFYSVEAARHNWTDEDNQYRWVRMKGVLRKEMYAGLLRYARVPDQLPRIHSGDLVDVYEINWHDTDYGALKADIVVKLVCRSEDSACFKRSKAEIGGRSEIVSVGKPDMSGFTFTKQFDVKGKPLSRMN
jgi:DNA-directed RNA polymerase subunit H (RpoH/RPB5)